ncbi:MAG: hypothetical protein UT21_C0006G0012 [Candidatus Woesebacteria bacterium GW2011_GWA1_39_11b]|nr:MAG: hypothetical protein UT21_C0006G0012 [Candidatus Woesebacteria bacterium GW2011_GWA1_39_11b]
MAKFKLKSGDDVFVALFLRGKKPHIQKARIDGFRCYGICYKDHPLAWHHYSTGLFYGFGYHGDGFVLVTKKEWHVRPAVLAEAIRLNLPQRICKKIGLE